MAAIDTGIRNAIVKETPIADPLLSRHPELRVERVAERVAE